MTDVPASLDENENARWYSRYLSHAPWAYCGAPRHHGRHVRAFWLEELYQRDRVLCWLTCNDCHRLLEETGGD